MIRDGLFTCIENKGVRWRYPYQDFKLVTCEIMNALPISPYAVSNQLKFTESIHEKCIVQVT